MKCGVCKQKIAKGERREHLKLHKLNDTLVDWILKVDDDLIMRSASAPASAPLSLKD